MSRSGMSRRDFLRISGGAGAGLFFVGQIGGQLFEVPVAAAQIPGGTLDPRSVPKYQTPLLIPPVMPRAGTINQAGRQAGRLLRDLDAAVRPAGSAGGDAGHDGVGVRRRSPPQSNRGLLVHNAPSLTIEAQYNRPVRVKWINDLVDADGNYLPHLLPVDPTLHWANPPGGTAGRDDATDVHGDARPVHGPGADRHPRPRRRRRRRRERRLRRGLVPARRRQHPGRLRHRGHLVRLLRRQGGGEATARRGVPGSPPSSTRTWAGRRPPGTTTTPWG